MVIRVKSRWVAGMFIGLLVCICGVALHGVFREEKQEVSRQQVSAKAAAAGEVALTFDDGPHPAYTEALLDGLKERNVSATFFVLGEHAELYPELIRRMREEGHLIGNHTYSHLQLEDGNWEVYRQELTRTNELICEITGTEPCFVRPPYGSWDRSFEQELNMFPVLWTVDSRDWCSRDASDVVSKVVEETKEGDIILMHDYYASTVDAALQVVDRLLELGYRFVTVEELLFD